MGETNALIQSEINKLLGIEVNRLFELGLIPLKHARKWLVKEKYYRLARTGRTYTDIKLELSVEYGISISTIEKMVYRK